MTMGEAHRRDYADKSLMDELRRQMETFLASSSRLSAGTRSALDNAAEHLQREADEIVRRWN